MKLSFTQYIPIHVLLFFTLLSDTSNVSAATIGDWIWADANDNGLLEGGEGGIGDIGVDLLNNAGNVIASTTSNHDGYYIFKDLSAGTYTVAIHQGMLIAPLTTPATYTVTVAENEAFLKADFGLLTTFSTSNKPPVIITKNSCTAPQTPVTVCLDVFEPEGDNTNITAGTTQTGATFTILNEDCFRYTPLPGYEGIDTILVTVCDDANPILCTEGKIAISVPCPGGPLAVDDEVTTTQSTPIIIEVLANDNGQAPLEVTNVGNPSNGTVMLVNNIIIYTPEAGFTGQDSFTYAIKDGSNQTSSATVYITVEETPIDCELEMMQCIEINTSPIICPEYCEVEGSSLNILEITSQIGSEFVESPSEEGCYKYAAPMNFTGTDVITILACNDEGNCVQTTINIEVTTDCDGGGNGQIIANDDFVVAIQNTFVLIGVLTNDVDPQGDDFSIQGFEQPSNGTVTLTEDGLFNYVPNTGFVGTDMFTYRICDVNGNCDEATVTINVIDDGITDCTQNAEVCDSATTATEICVEFCNVGDAVITEASSVIEGTISISSATCFNYLPPEGFTTGIDEIDVVGCNTSGECDTILVTVTIACPAPDASDDIGGTMVGQMLNLNVLENDAQICDYILSATLIGEAQMGEAVLDSNGNLSYTPNETAAGQEILEYIACNDCANALCDTANIIITVGDTFNQPPIAVDDQSFTLLNTPIDIFILLNDSDPDGDNLSATILDAPSNGTAAINPDTQIATYTPNTGFEGVDSFTYLLCDSGNPVLCDTATVTVTIGGISVNNPPLAGDDEIVTQLNASIGVGVLGNDSDPDGDNVIVTAIASPPSNGTAEFNPSSVIYTPNENFVGMDTLEYVLCDDGIPVLCDTATVIITVINPSGNLPPIAVDDNATIEVNTQIGIDVLENDNDPEGGNLTITLISTEPSNGTVFLGNGLLNYTPNIDFIGVDSFEYVICDPQGLCDTALVVVTVEEAGTNQAPVAVGDNATTEVNTPIEIPVLDNDSDPNGDELTVTINDAPSNGTAVVEDGIPTYTPNEDFIGVDSFEYVICDPQGLCDTALVVVTVEEGNVNQAPIAVDDNAATEENTSIEIPVLDNDSDPNGDELTVTINDAPSNGTVVIEDGTINYTPNEDFTGVDSFEYVICDPQGLCDTALVVVTVLEEGTNQAPVAVGDAETIDVNVPLAIDVLENDSDPNGDDISLVSIPTTPENGIAEFNIDSSAVVYTPNEDFIGEDSFEYVICDNGDPVLCDTALVIITVEESDENETPIAVDDVATTSPNMLIDISVLENDSDPDGDELTIIDINETPSNGSAEINDESTGIAYTPNEGFEGADTLEYVICDPDGFCDTAMVIINVFEPLFPIIADTTDEDTPLTVCVEEFLDTIGFSIDSMNVFVLPENGTVLINDTSLVSDSCFLYTPTENFNGGDTFLLGICNVGENTCDTITVNITVLPVNDPPIATDDLANTEVNTPIEIPVLENDSDIDGNVLAVVAIEESPSNGEAIINPDGTITYTPDIDFAGVDTFIYVISDPDGLTDTATVLIGIGQGLGLIAVDDVDSTEMETSVEIPVLENDLFDGVPTDSTTISILSNASNGVLVVNGDDARDSTVIYTPLPEFFGMDTFEYVVCVAELCDTATVVIVVTEVVDECVLFIPNAFSPNNDGANDRFVIPNLAGCFPDNELAIFNRWGDEIFRQQNYDETSLWDGTWQKNGEEVPDGTYFYILTGLGEEGEQLEPRSGFIEVCR